jgi:cephalosporin hydroxylase
VTPRFTDSSAKEDALQIKRLRIGLLLLGILILSLKLTFVSNLLDKWAVNRVQLLVQKREEFKNRWLGIGVIQYPSDLLAYAELINEVRPDLIIETGTNYGGLAVFLASVLQNLDPHSKVVTIDIESERWQATKISSKLPSELLSRIEFLQGNSVSDQILNEVRRLADGRRAMVILDSLHTVEHVSKELNLYSQFVALDSYLIVNDTHLESLGIMGFRTSTGPLTAVQQFLQSDSRFTIDSRYPKSIISCAPSGFLRRVR